MVVFRQIFTKNPFRSLMEHMQKSIACVEKTEDLFKSLFSGNRDEVAKIAKEISMLEHDCDEIKRALRQRLSSSVFLPVDKRDILQVLSNMDAIADNAEDLGVLLTLRWMELPQNLQPAFWDLLHSTHKVVKKSAVVIDSLDRLFETGFSGPDAKDVLGKIDEIDSLEHEADKAQDIFGKLIFEHEDSFKPAALFMWIKIANKTGDLANCAERMCGQLRLMLAEQR